jgi:ketosteroid isomerase-like protein
VYVRIGHCAGAAAALQSRAMTNPKQVVRRYLDALVAGDLETIRDSFAADAVWTIHGDLPIAGPWRGRDAIVDEFLVAAAGTLYEPGSVEFEFPTLIGEGDTVVLEWRVRARTAAGADYANAYCGLFRVRHGRIAEVREYLDTDYAAKTLFGASTPA